MGSNQRNSSTRGPDLPEVILLETCRSVGYRKLFKLGRIRFQSRLHSLQGRGGLIFHTSCEGGNRVSSGRYSDLLRLSQRLTTLSIGHEVKSRSAVFRSSCLALYSASQHSYKRFRCSSHFAGEYVLRLRQLWRSQAGLECQEFDDGIRSRTLDLAILILRLEVGVFSVAFSHITGDTNRWHQV